ncbi:Glutamyl-tRNA reductase, partial [Bienertia sinuspersici]
MTHQFMQCVIKPSSGLPEFFCSFIYAHNDGKLRESLWQDLINISSNQRGPWLLMGDFNCVIDMEERIGNIVRQREMEKPFKYFKMWQLTPDYTERIKKAWGVEMRGTAMYKIVQKLKKVKASMKELNKHGFNDMQAEDSKRYQEMMGIQEKLHRDPMNAGLMEEEKEATQQYHLAHKKYSQYLKQKAKVAWLREGDDNTALFHNCLRRRNIQNHVYAIKDKTGVLQDSPEGIQAAFVDYYSDLLGWKMGDREA